MRPVVPVLSILTASLALCAAPGFADTDRVPAQAPAGNARAAAVFARMATLKVSLDFDDAPATKVFAWLRQVSGINLVIDGSVRADGLLDDRRVSLEVTDIPFRSALTLVLEFTELTARWKHGVLFITTADRAVGEMTLRLYDVRDITFTLAPMPGPTIALPNGNGMDELGSNPFGDEPENAAPSADDIVQTVQDALGEAFEIPGASMTQLGGQLVVRQTAEAHAQILRVLAQLRSAR